MSWKLGKRPTPAALRAVLPQGSLAATALLAAPPAPALRGLTQLGLYANDQFGDCVLAAMANLARLDAQLEGYDLGIHTGDVLKAYKLFGFAPPLADPGIRIGDALVWLCQKGWSYGSGQAPLTGPSLVLDHTDLGKLQRWSQVAGAGMLGVQLSLADQDAIGEVWDTSNAGTSPGAADTPGSWGEHCLIGPCESDSQGCWLGTWGRWQRASWGWLSRALDEAYGVVLRELEGLDRQRLMQQMMELEPAGGE